MTAAAAGARKAPRSWDVPSGDGDPTTDLLELAQHQRDANLGVLLGDLRRAGYDVTRWEFYASLFRIELSDELREQLSGHWKEREPRY